ncbi:MFS transporter [Myceligenerans sp. TRM 65318]|uniref:MFS transporter n=2 Tax=Myceligenerans pegani TaxID=2776917 RepID=A0ABR9N2B9_9MICO|nr:MFS transporter [Myceligenerans sp. TRM 65318]MBE3020070.1 MFS transporter [Myceligenerans sp. TRM 65318]
MFLVVLDSAMVNLAGSRIREDLGLSAAGLTVVVDSYLVAFAGLLLLGGRLADVLGAKRLFMAGMTLYLAASVFCATASGGAMLVTGRIAQGIGAAVLMPAALSLVLALYRSPAERTRAMGIWGVVAGAGSLTGVFLGGVLTGTLGWQAVFAAPVPLGVVGMIVVWRRMPSVPGRPGSFDLPGAATITLGISAVALGSSAAAESGWGSPAAIGGLLVGAVALTAFALVERRAAHPLVPLSVFRRTTVVKANTVMLLTGGTLTSLFFFLPQYQQEELGMSPTATGMAQVPIALMIIVGSGLAPLTARLLGLDNAQRTGLAMLLAGYLWLAFDPTTSGFSAGLLGSFLMIGAGLGLSLVNATAMGVRNSADGESGLLSGLVNAAQQVGGAVGLAVLAGVAIGAAGTPDDIDFTTAFGGGAALVAIAIAVSFLPTSSLPRDSRRAAPSALTTPRKEDLR